MLWIGKLIKNNGICPNDQLNKLENNVQLIEH